MSATRPSTPGAADDLGKRTVKRLVLLVLVVFVGGYLLVFAVTVVGVTFDLPSKLVAGTASGLVMIGAVVFAVIMGRRIRSDRERAQGQTGLHPDESDKPSR